MIISWIKPDGTKFMAFIADSFENNLMQFCKVHNARPLNEDELKKYHNLESKDKKQDTPYDVPPQKNNPQIQQTKKKWWKR